MSDVEDASATRAIVDETPLAVFRLLVEIVRSRHHVDEVSGEFNMRCADDVFGCERGGRK